MEDEVLRITENDCELDKRLMAQSRPLPPESLREARRQVELLTALGIAQSLSFPEATVAATQAVAWLERHARRSAYPWGGDAYTKNGGKTVIIPSSLGDGGITVSQEALPTLIDMLKSLVTNLED